MEQKTFAKLIKAIIIGVGIRGLFIYLYIIPDWGSELVAKYPEFGYCYLPWLIFLWITAIPCYAVLCLGWKITTNIGNDKSFSRDNANLLKWIATLAAGDSLFFFVGNVVLLFCNMNHPGILVASMIIVFAGVSITIVAAALSHLVRKAAILQEQADLTI